MICCFSLISCHYSLLHTHASTGGEDYIIRLVLVDQLPPLGFQQHLINYISLVNKPIPTTFKILPSSDFPLPHHPYLNSSSSNPRSDQFSCLTKNWTGTDKPFPAKSADIPTFLLICLSFLLEF